MNNLLRQHYLQAIGIQSWLLRSSVEEFEDIEQLELSEDAEKTASAEHSDAESISQGQTASRVLQSHQLPASAGSAAAPIISWTMPQNEVKPVSADSQAAAAESVQIVVEKKPATAIPAASAETAQPVSKLQQSISGCRKCPSRAGRLTALAGQGNQDASVFVISEPPNADEDRSGRYLSGQAQHLFTAMLQTIQLDQAYFFTGILKCFSFKDYRFSEEEAGFCSEYLQAQIEQTQPAVILVLGAAPSQTMLQSKNSFNELRGKVYSVTINNHDYPLLISYHPAYLLRNPLFKREALKDLILLKNLLK